MAASYRTQPPPPPPPPPPQEEGDVGFLTLFNGSERPYIRSMKKRDRVAIFKTLERSMKESRFGEAPLRVLVLQSKLPSHMQLNIFQALRAGVTEKYVNWVQRAIELPLQVEVRPKLSVERAREILEAEVTGQEAAKLEVLKMVCQVTSGGTTAGSYSLALEGPPGTGKTYFIRNAMAKALGRPFVSIPMGGATDVSFLLGHNYTYEGSKPGRLVDALIEAKCCNPIIHMDEPDKVGERGRELLDFLVHLIDPTQNSHLRDRYLHGIDIDFSKCTFVFSFNDASKIPPILLDRMKRIHMGAPSSEQKMHIVRDHILPRIQRRINDKQTLSTEVIEHLVSISNKDGMREVEKYVDHVLAMAQLVRPEAIDLPFVKETITTLQEADRALQPPPPPACMYT